MERAIEIAKKGTGKTNPNPLVGAVIVKDGRILAEGYHACYGSLHAERDAISKLKESAEGADMYVTLEPCCHYGKQPPCTLAIIENKIKNVYVGSSDPNELVAGKGIKQLRDAGINVVEHVMKEECDALNTVFFHYITKKMPYVVMKYAMTADGKIACDSGASKWVTGEIARNHVQETRNALAAIMVGVQTVINDNPSLTCRLENGNNPIRVICDSNLRIPLDSEIIKTAKDVITIIATTSQDKEKIDTIKSFGAEVVTVSKNKAGKVDLFELMEKLGEMKIDSVLLEGGGNLNQSALKAGVVNHVQAYIAPKIFGGRGRYTPVTGDSVDVPDKAYMLRNTGVEMLGEDILIEYDIVYK